MPSVSAAGSSPAASSVTELVQTFLGSSGLPSPMPAILATSHPMDIFPGLLQLWDGCVESGGGVPWLAALNTQADGCPSLPAPCATATKGHFSPAAPHLSSFPWSMDPAEIIALAMR